MTFSSQEIIFQPFFPNFSRFEKIPKLILMSATLGSEFSLSYEFGSKLDLAFIKEDEFNPDDLKMGNRLIFPLLEEYKEEKARIETCINLANEFEKILVLAYTNKERDQISEKLNENEKEAIIYSDYQDIVKFVDSESAYLLSAGRYFGLDLPENSCKVAVITKIPEFVSHFEFILENTIGNKKYIDELTAHRVIQSFGRCNQDSRIKRSLFCS